MTRYAAEVGIPAKSQGGDDLPQGDDVPQGDDTRAGKGFKS
jgi:hypothetical protein